MCRGRGVDREQSLFGETYHVESCTVSTPSLGRPEQEICTTDTEVDDVFDMMDRSSSEEQETWGAQRCRKDLCGLWKGASGLDTDAHWSDMGQVSLG
jgi:hypothetical protein